VGVHLVEIAKPVVETLLARLAGRARIAQPPFANARGDVAGLLERFGNGQILGLQKHQRPTLEIIEAGHGGVVAAAAMAGVQSGHERAARRRADRRTAVMLREPRPLAAEPIEGRRLDGFAPQVAIARVVQHDINDIRPLGGVGGCRKQRDEKENEC
jgi:hypothetical protein